MTTTGKRHSPEVRERAVRMVREHAGEHSSQWSAIVSISSKVGCTAETLRRWIKDTERREDPVEIAVTDEKARMRAPFAHCNQRLRNMRSQIEENGAQ